MVKEKRFVLSNVKEIQRTIIGYKGNHPIFATQGCLYLIQLSRFLYITILLEFALF